MQTGTAETYATFTRTWWRHNPAWPDGREPHPGRKTYHGRRLTQDEARRMCQRWNEEHNPGPLSRKMEYESE